MKSHTDAASRSVVEVVTQLPVPSRLGMLRFERLNEASWALLFLDSTCERALGIAAGELCAPDGLPYASLMEPEARYLLHDAIQMQLSQSNHYLVHYTLHSPQGPLHMLELGEGFKQHGRQLLRGYLLVADEPPRRAAAPAQPELAQENARLRSSLELYKRNQEDHLQHLQRSRMQQQLIVRLARHRYTSAEPLREAAEQITRAACELYELARASIWQFNGEQLQVVACYRGDSDRFEQPEPLDINQFPRYLEALLSGRAIDAHNALRDPRTAELAHYFQPLGICAVLDAGVRVDGELVGVLCLEHSVGSRAWQSDEIAFAGELADHFAHVKISQQKRHATDALSLFQRAVEQSASAFLLVDRDGLVQYVNPSFSAITLYSADELQGRRLSDLPALESLGDLLLEAPDPASMPNNWHYEFRSRRKNFEPYWGQLSISKVYGNDGELTHYIGIYQDITDIKLTQQRVERLAYTDNLTNLSNRPAFIRTLGERFGEATPGPVALLLVDIDNFKRINDSLGHQIGDKLLMSLARRLRNSLQPGNMLARFASNEFAVLLDGIGCDSARETAQGILAILDKPIFVDNQLINVTASLGLACSPQHGDTPQTLMKHAGLALHKAKANGKNQLQVFTEILNTEADYKLFVENNLRRALTQNELEVYYQPKLCLRTGQLVGVEALLRWVHPQKGMIAPDQFISVAEETGLIIPIGKWVARQACRMSKQLLALGFPRLQVAINLSPKQFSDPDLVGSIAAILREEQLPSDLLELELTESLLLEATEDTRLQLTALKSLGLTLAMDDFGTGYSSLSYLKKFPIDVIKIDRSFIKDIPGNQDDMEITSAVIAMAHKLNLQVVAEGIETVEQLAVLRRQKCNIGQGYLFDKPIPGKELIERLRAYSGRSSG